MEDEAVKAQAEGPSPVPPGDSPAEPGPGGPGDGARPELDGGACPEPDEGGVAAASVLGDEVARLREGLALATAKYRALLLHAHPEVPEELVGGDTVEAVDASFLSAREVVEKVRSRLEARLAAEPRIGAGAPPRGAADLSALSPREKIALALGRRES